MADAAPVAVAHDLGYYLRPIRRHPRLIAACILLGLVLSVAYAAALRPVYTATAKVQVQADIIDNQTSLANGRTSAAVNMDNEVQLLKSEPVALIAQKTLKTTTGVGKLAKKITFVVPPNSTVMKISCTGHSSASATDCANAFANAYLTNRQNVIDAYVKGQTDAIDAKLAIYRNDLVTDSATLRSTAPHSQAHKLAFSRQQADQTNISGQNSQLSNLNKENTLPKSYVASPAAAAGSSPNQKREMIVLAGIVLGALLGLVAAPLRDRMDKLVRTSDDLDREDLELIAEIKAAPRGRRGKSHAARKADTLARTRAEQRLAAVIGAALGQEGGSVYLAELSDTVGEQGFADRLAAELGRFGSTTEVVTLGTAPRTTIDPRTLHPTPTTRAIEAAPATPEPTTPAPSAPAPHHTPRPMLGWPSSDRVDVADDIDTTPAEPSAPQPVSHDVVPTTLTNPPATISDPPRTAPPMDEVAGVLQDVQAALARSRYVVVHGPNATIGSEAYNLASLSVVTALVVEAGVTTRAELADVVDQVEVTASEVLGAMLWRPAPDAKRRRRTSRSEREPREPRAPRVPKPPKPAKDAKSRKPAKDPKAAKAPKPGRSGASSPSKPARGEKKNAPSAGAGDSKSVRLLRKKSPPVDGFVPSAPPDLATLNSDDDADPGSRARPFDPAR